MPTTQLKEIAEQYTSAESEGAPGGDKDPIVRLQHEVLLHIVDNDDPVQAPAEATEVLGFGERRTILLGGGFGGENIGPSNRLVLTFK